MKDKKIELTARELVYLRCLIECDISNLRRLLATNNTEEYKERIIEMINEAYETARKLN